MKINILYEFRENAWGGGNQFLKALRDKFIELGTYTDDPYSADVILFNSDKVSILKQIDKICRIIGTGNKVIINRVDGPIGSRNKQLKYLDRVISLFDKNFCSGAVVQSQWSLAHMRMRGYSRETNLKIIFNAPDPNIFFRKKDERTSSPIIKLIATSWSSNYEAKGFDIYEYLDQHIDQQKYQITFIGNSPIKFKQIRYLSARDSKMLASEIREHDIFITASKDDPCSNSLIEGLHCGLPAVYRISGGHPELVKKGGVGFKDKKDVLAAIDLCSQKISQYKNDISVNSLDETAIIYKEFFRDIFERHKKKGRSKINNKHISLLKLKVIIFWGKLISRIKYQ